MLGWFLVKDKIKWCVSKNEGLQLIDSNSNLAKAYIKKAQDAIESMRADIVRDWKISTAYYSLYFSLYAIMMKIGIRCEIHSCTIEFAKRFLKDYFNESEFKFLKNALKARIDSQYYVDRAISDDLYSGMIKMAPLFFVKCKSILGKLTEKRISAIRSEFDKAVKL